MSEFSKTLGLIMAMALAIPAAAQQSSEASGDAAAETTTEAPAAGAETQAGTETGAQSEAAPESGEVGLGQTYVAETFGDWQLRCIRTEDGSDPCQIYQLIPEKKTNKPFAEIAIIALPGGAEAVAGATVTVPLETLLPQMLNMTVDKGQTKRYPYNYCTEIGCVARLGLTTDDMAAFRKGNVATITVIPAPAPTEQVSVDISLKGFTAAFDAVAKINLEQASKTAQ